MKDNQFRDEGPEPEVPGGISVRYKQGEQTKIELTVRYFVDSWYQMGFDFTVDEKTAELKGIEPPGDTYWVQQSEQARHEAIRQVSDLPFVEHVDMGR